jgi:hypothetical protein
MQQPDKQLPVPRTDLFECADSRPRRSRAPASQEKYNVATGIPPAGQSRPIIGFTTFPFPFYYISCFTTFPVFGSRLASPTTSSDSRSYRQELACHLYAHLYFLQSEIDLLKNLNVGLTQKPGAFLTSHAQHANIVKYKGFVKTREFLYIIMESVHNINNFRYPLIYSQILRKWISSRHLQTFRKIS